MESFALMSAQTQQRRSVAMWAACGAACVLAVWSAVSAVSAMTNAHVQVQQQSTTTGRVAQVRSQAVSRQTSTTALAAAPVPPPTGLQPMAAAAAASGVPMLTVAAMAVGLFAAFFAFWRRQEQTPAAVPAGGLGWQPRAPDSDEAARRKPPARIDEVATVTKEEQARRKNLTPKQVILELQQGNARFWSGTPERPELRAIERRALIVGQAPTVAILSCSDSRVPVEILFDQGLGDVFVVRVAGNILDPVAMGSIEFSVKYLGVKVLLVMGHEGCGAVKGAMSMSSADIDQQPEYLQSVLRSIQGNLDLGRLTRIRDSRSQDREAIVVNVSSQVRRLQQNPLIAERVANGTLLVCGAFYEITSGIVDFFSLDKNGLVIDV